MLRVRWWWGSLLFLLHIVERARRRRGSRATSLQLNINVDVGNERAVAIQGRCSIVISATTVAIVVESSGPGTRSGSRLRGQRYRPHDVELGDSSLRGRKVLRLQHTPSPTTG